MKVTMIFAPELDAQNRRDAALAEANKLGLSLEFAVATPDTGMADLVQASSALADAIVICAPPETWTLAAPIPNSFTVELQPDNISAKGLASAGTDAQIFGFGPASDTITLRLLAERFA